MSNYESRSSNLSPSQLETLIQICDRFEVNWRAGLRPRIAMFTADAPEPDRLVLLRELIALELRLRLELGEQPTPADYHGEFPGQTALISSVFESLNATSLANDRLLLMSRDATAGGPCDPDATLAYSVGRGGGKVEAILDADRQQELRVAFAKDGVVQDRYRIDAELGRGGMGVVWLGRDLRLDRPVAIKASLLQAQTCDRDDTQLAALRSAFADEARLGANLTHPAIATVYDYGFHGDKPFTVFEYLPGECLSDLLRRRTRLPMEEVRLIIGPLAQALDFAHARRVVHRDLKPDNIRATEQGLFKLLDLGLAREFGRDLDWSGFAGTPAYASPEQASGLPCDGRADQYALALITFEALSGHRLFQARDVCDLLAMQRETEPTAVATDLAAVSEAVRLALSRALSKDPNARFATCSDFALAIGCHLLNAPAPAPEILMDADVERMTVGRVARSVSFPWLKNAVHLVLTREALWSAYHTEVRRWPLSNVEEIEPQSDTVDDREAVALADAGIIRRLHRDAEANIRLIGRLRFIVLAPLLLVLLVIVGLTIFVAPRVRAGPTLVALGLLPVVGGWLFVVNRGLRQFRPWSRWAALTEGLVGMVFAAGLLGALVAIPSFAAPAPALLLPVPFFALAAWVVWTLFSRKATALFTPSYRKVVERTPHLDPRPALRLDRASRRTLRLTLRAPGDCRLRVAFRFPTASECRHWAETLAALARRPADPAAPGDEVALAEPALVVLLRQRPTARYQLLGTVEAKAVNRRTAKAGLQVRAAMMGGESVVDVQEEVLPDFRRTVRRLTGTAVRAVDAEGRFEFRSRWYADRVAWVSTWSLVLLMVSLPVSVLGSVLFQAIEHGRHAIMAGAPVAPLTPQSGTSNALWHLSGVFLTIAAIHLWPIGLATLARGLRWPQFVRPLALTLVAFGLRPVYLLIGSVAAAVVSGGWAGLAYLMLSQFDPVNLLVMAFSLFLARAAWRADREFRFLVPAAARHAPLSRSIGGQLSLAGSLVYMAILACLVVWAGYVTASQFRLPTAVNRKAATAAAQFEAGVALLRSKPAEAEVHFRTALSLWEDLAREVPAELDYQIKLAAVRTLLATTAIAQGRLAEAREQLAMSAATWDALGSGPLPASKRAVVDQNRSSVRASLRSIEYSLGMEQGQRLSKAGDVAGAVAAFRRALDFSRALPGGALRGPALDALNDKNEAVACNALAWRICFLRSRSPKQILESVTLAERAVALDPKNPDIWNTLALARYRNGDWTQASSAIEHTERLRGGGNAGDRVILAMIRFRQGDRAQARHWYVQSANLIEQQRPPNEDLRTLRAEAESLLE